MKEADKYPDYMRLFCGVKGFEWNKTSDMNPINTILIVVAESFEGVLEEILTNDEESVSTFVYTKDRYKHLFNK